jgi:hypothetical protein
MNNNSYRTRYVGEILDSMDKNKNRVAYSESSGAVEVLCQIFTDDNTLLRVLLHCRIGMPIYELSTYLRAERGRSSGWWRPSWDLTAMVPPGL